MRAIGNFKLKLSLDTRYNSKLEENKGKYPVKLYLKSIITNKNKYINSDIYCSVKVFTALFPEYAKPEWKSHKTFFETQTTVANKNIDLNISFFYIVFLTPRFKHTLDIINTRLVFGNLSLYLHSLTYHFGYFYNIFEDFLLFKPEYDAILFNLITYCLSPF